MYNRLFDKSGDILRREEGKQTLAEQHKQYQKEPDPAIDTDQKTNIEKTMLSAEDVKHMSAEDMWKYIKGVN